MPEVLTKAAEEPGVWAAIFAGLLSVLGAKKWAARVRGVREEGDAIGRLERSLASVEKAIREEGSATRKTIHDRAESTDRTLRPIAEGVRVLLDRGGRA